MSTTMQSSRSDETRTKQFGKGIAAVGAIIAIGVSILFLSMTGSHRGAAAPTTPEHTASPAVTHAVSTPSPPPGYFRDPTTHALVKVSSSGKDAAVSEPNQGLGPH
jgi:hypothetical protein